MEKNSNKGLKKLVLLLLLFVGLGASVTAGAYWASSFTVNTPEVAEGTVTVEVGEGKTVEVITELNAELLRPAMVKQIQSHLQLQQLGALKPLVPLVLFKVVQSLLLRIQLL